MLCAQGISGYLRSRAARNAVLLADAQEDVPRHCFAHFVGRVKDSPARAACPAGTRRRLPLSLLGRREITLEINVDGGRIAQRRVERLDHTDEGATVESPCYMSMYMLQ